MTKSVLATAAIAMILSAPSVSQAWDGHSQEASGPAVQLRPSVSFLHGWGEHTNAFGLGLDYIHFPTTKAWNLGAFAEGFRELDGAWRAAGGFRAGYGGFALRLGVAHRTSADGFLSNTAIQVGKVFNWGPVGLGWRVSIPFHQGQADQGLVLRERGVEWGVTVSLGWSFNVIGERPSFGTCHPHH